MSELPDHIADAMIAYLREENPALNERQARLDLAAIAEVGKAREGRLIQQDRVIPTALYYLAEDLAEVYLAHTGKILSRAKRGGNGPEMLLTLANAVEVADLKTGMPYSLIQAQEAIKSTQDARNKKLNTKMMPGPWQRDDARKDYLTGRVVGYADEDGNIVSKDDPAGQPIVEGYQPAPDRERIAAGVVATAKRLLAKNVKD